VQSGPSSIVAAIGDARRATDVILKRENLKSHHGEKYWLNANPADITRRKGAVVVNIVKKSELQSFVKQEGERCLECNYVCSKCVDVCRTGPISQLPCPVSRIDSRPCISMLLQ